MLQVRREKWRHILQNFPSSRQDNLNTKHSPYYEQILLDVNRSLSFCQHYGEERKDQFKKQLNFVIEETFKLGSNDWKYYQGFHDIASIVILIYKNRPLISLHFLSIISTHYLAPFLTLSILEIQTHFLNKVYRIIQKYDAKLYSALQPVNNIFMISWILTWFSHDIPQLPRIMCIFDHILDAHPLFPIYIAASVLLLKTNEILARFQCNDEFEMYAYLQKLPRRLELEECLEFARHLYWNEDEDLFLFSLYGSFNEIYPEKIPQKILVKLKPTIPFNVKILITSCVILFVALIVSFLFELKFIRV